MGLFVPQSILDEIVSRIDIISTLSKYLTLQKVGKDYKGLCPFHQEKSPSFLVDSIKGVYHCFGCGAGGNFYNLIEKLESLNFTESVEFLADIAGLDLSEYQKKTDQAQIKQFDIYYKVMQYALWFFREQLKSEISLGSHYLRKRILKEETVHLFKLGFSPDNWQGLTNFLQSKGVPLSIADQLGLIKKNASGKYYDFYRGRLIFPIEDLKDRVIGFGGRNLLDNDHAKYINSKESPIYHKSQNLYGLNQAIKGIRNFDQVIIVEGYFDVLRLFDLGITCGVAPLGTALTQEQVVLLKKYTSNFVLMFDADQAGETAAIKSIELILKNKLHPKIVELPQKEDPDSYGLAKGKDNLLTEIQKAHYAIDWLWQKKLKNPLNSVKEKTMVADDLKKYIALVDNSLERKAYLSKLALFLNIPESEVAGLEVKSNQRPIRKKVQDSYNKDYQFIKLVIENPQCFSSVNIQTAIDLIDDNEVVQLIFELKSIYEKKFMLDEEIIEQSLNERALDLIRKLANYQKLDIKDDEIEGFLEDFIKQKKRNQLKSQLVNITNQLQIAEMSNDEDQIKDLISLKSEIQSKILII